MSFRSYLVNNERQSHLQLFHYLIEWDQIQNYCSLHL